MPGPTVSHVVLDASPPDVSRIKRNFIFTAVCELRFPILLELYDDPPAKLAKLQAALRGTYPRYERKWEITLEDGGVPTKNPRYFMVSAKGRWTVVIKPEGIALETDKYGRFPEFRERLDTLIATAREHLDFNFFTRVGLRYINRLPRPTPELEGWVNESLIAPLKLLPSPTRLKHEIRGKWGRDEAYNYTLRHGTEAEDHQVYLLDLDLAADNVEFENLDPTLRNLKQASNNLFFWAIGPEAVRHLEVPA